MHSAELLIGQTLEEGKKRAIRRAGYLCESGQRRPDSQPCSNVYVREHRHIYGGILFSLAIGWRRDDLLKSLGIPA